MPGLFPDIYWGILSVPWLPPEIPWKPMSALRTPWHSLMVTPGARATPWHFLTVTWLSYMPTDIPCWSEWVWKFLFQMRFTRRLNFVFQIWTIFFRKCFSCERCAWLMNLRVLYICIHWYCARNTVLNQGDILKFTLFVNRQNVIKWLLKYHKEYHIDIT